MFLVSKSSNFLRYQSSKILVTICALFFILPMCKCDCELYKPSDPSESKKEMQLLNIIKPLNGRTFETKDILPENNYTYKVSICGKMEDQPDNVGAVQITPNKTHRLGMYNKADIMGGTDWILLIYYGGSAYHSFHCNESERITNIMIICDPDNIAGTFEIIEERRKESNTGCYYLFELSSNVACSKSSGKASKSIGLSSGSVFCILFFTFVTVYIIGGVLYKRIVIGSKGMEQIPNYAFWKEFGNLQADGCDYFCRCSTRQESQAYRGIDEHMRTEEERDDQLLNM